MPSSSGTARSGSSVFSSTASATGSIISVVAVLEIHIDSSAVAAMKPNTSRRLLACPNSRTMPSATRRWAPEEAIAVDRMKPPSSSRISGWP